MERDRLVNRINRRLDLPLAFLSLVMLGMILVDLLADVPPETRFWLERLNWGLWSIFAVEYLVKLVVAESARAYMRDHWFDALVLIVPTFRVLRAMRLLRVTRAFPAFRLAAFMGMGLRGMAGLSGATVTGEGRVALILDFPGLVRAYGATLAH